MWEDAPPTALLNDILEQTDVGGREVFEIVHGGENVIFPNSEESSASLSKKKGSEYQLLSPEWDLVWFLTMAQRVSESIPCCEIWKHLFSSFAFAFCPERIRNCIIKAP